MPPRSVTERSLVARKVMRMLNRMRSVRSAAERSEPKMPLLSTKNMVKMAIKAGNRPLQGTRLLVRMASRRSRGESMMRHPTTPAALHPKPMHMVG